MPERRELDETQEVNWRFVAKTTADLGYTSDITHEWRVTPGQGVSTASSELAALDA